MCSDNLLVLNDLGRLLEEVQDNSGNVKGDARLLHKHVFNASFGESTQEIREHFNQNYLKLINSEHLMTNALQKECKESLHDLIFKIYQTLSKSQLKNGFSATLEVIDYIRCRLSRENLYQALEDEERAARNLIYGMD